MYRVEYGWYDNNERIIVSEMIFSSLVEAEGLKDRLSALDVEFSFIEVVKVIPVKAPVLLLWTIEETMEPDIFNIEFSGASVTFDHDSIVSLYDGYLFAMVAADSKEAGMAAGIKAIEDKGGGWVNDNGYEWTGQKWSKKGNV